MAPPEVLFRMTTEEKYMRGGGEELTKPLTLRRTKRGEGVRNN